MSAKTTGLSPTQSMELSEFPPVLQLKFVNFTALALTYNKKKHSLDYAELCW